jgi:pyruvate dehydrogenase E1 component beta subunit
MFCHIPGLYVVYPATPADAKGMLKSAIRDNNPVLFVESQALYGMKGLVPEGEYLVPLGVADVKRAGTDITLVAWGPLVHDCLKAADKLKAERGVSAEVIDLRSLVPLDLETILRSVQKTGRCVVASQAIHIGSYTGEITSTLPSNAWAPRTASRRSRTFSKRRSCPTSMTSSPPPTPSCEVTYGYPHHHAQIRSDDRRERHC